MIHPKKHNLILITNHFPYGGGEAFLENEINFLTSSFDKVIIAARDVVSTGERKGNFRAYRINPSSNMREMILAAGLYMMRFPKILQYISSEIKALRSANRPVSLPVISILLHDLTKALITSYHLKKLIKTNQLEGHVILYSYWLTNSALATAFVRSNRVTLKRIARAHGGDVYEFRHRLNYISYRATLGSELDAIFPISEHGRNHLLKFIDPVNARKIKVARLGSSRPVQVPEPSQKKRFLLVSCSYLLPVKRIDLLIDALVYLSDIPINWVHIGDGPLKKHLGAYASGKISAPSQVEYEFKGSMTNSELIRFYEKNFIHLFVNTSESEGIPVTIMEAQSFGIPVVAPETGGIPEIVSNSNGMTFPSDASAHQISHCIRQVLSASRETYTNLRINARRNWETRYNAEQNFPTFVDEIFKLTE